MYKPDATACRNRRDAETVRKNVSTACRAPAVSSCDPALFSEGCESSSGVGRNDHTDHRGSAAGQLARTGRSPIRHTRLCDGKEPLGRGLRRRSQLYRVGIPQTDGGCQVRCLKVFAREANIDEGAVINWNGTKLHLFCDPSHKSCQRCSDQHDKCVYRVSSVTLLVLLRTNICMV